MHGRKVDTQHQRHQSGLFRCKKRSMRWPDWCILARLHVEIQARLRLLQHRPESQETGKPDQQSEMKVGQSTVTCIKPFQATAQESEKRSVASFVAQAVKKEFAQEKCDGLLYRMIRQRTVCNAHMQVVDALERLIGTQVKAQFHNAQRTQEIGVKPPAL